jgi:fatty-acyl-CoA synthase
MMNVPLSTAAIVRHGVRVHDTARFRTLQTDGSIKTGTFGEVGRRSAPP